MSDVARGLLQRNNQTLPVLSRAHYSESDAVVVSMLNHASTNDRWELVFTVGMAQGTYRPAVGAVEVPPRLLALEPGAEGPFIAVVNGRVRADLSTIGALPAGVTILSLDDAIRRLPDVVESHFGKPDDWVEKVGKRQGGVNGFLRVFAFSGLSRFGAAQQNPRNPQQTTRSAPIIVPRLRRLVVTRYRNACPSQALTQCGLRLR